MVRLSQLVADQADIVELDINPLLADSTGAIGLDGRVRVRPATRSATSRLAIRPYPDDLAGTATMRDGTNVVLRPIRPEDETAIIELAGHMTRQDLRMRFFVAMKELTHQFAAKLTQIDYDREMAMVAEPEKRGEIWGVARFFADPDNVRAEFAVAVRSDLKGRGLGYALMTRLIEIARSRGIGELFGDVLSENDAMLSMCRDLGFDIGSHPTDPCLARAVKRLAITASANP